MSLSGDVSVPLDHFEFGYAGGVPVESYGSVAADAGEVGGGCGSGGLAGCAADGSAGVVRRGAGGGGRGGGFLGHYCAVGCD